MKKGIFYTGIVMVIASVIGNYLMFTSNQLDKPIFLNHFYKQPFYDDMSIELQYITNRYSDRVTDIAWVHVSGTDITLIPAYEYTIHTYAHYAVKAVRLQFANEIGMDFDNQLDIDELTVYFTNGETRSISDSKLIVYKPAKESPFEWKSGGGSSDDEGFSSLEAKDNVTITDLNIPFIQDVQSALSIHFNDQQAPGVFPISLEKENELSITYKLTFDQNDVNRFNLYDMDVTFSGEKESGESFIEHAIGVIYHPYFTEKEINKIVQGAQK